MTSLFDNIEDDKTTFNPPKSTITNVIKKDWFHEILDKTDEMDNWPDYELATYGSWK
jgi:hypothetical protein